MYATKRVSRRYKSAKTGSRRVSDSRVVKARYPRYRAPTSYNTIYPFERSVEWDVYLDLATGWNGRGLGMSVAWSLQNMIVTAGDGVVYGPTIPGYTEFSNLFDKWRIDRVDTKFIFSGTNHQIVSSSTNTFVMPVLNMVTDWNDNTPTDNLLEFPQVKCMQLGTGQNTDLTIYRPGTSGATESSAGTSVFSTVMRSPWLDTSTPTVVHYGTKFSYAQFNPVTYDYNPEVIIGCMKIRCKIYFSFSNPR